MLLKLLIDAVSLMRTKRNQILIKMRICYYRKKGIKIGHNFKISPETYIDLHKPEYIEIGSNVQITRWAMILCYDSSKDMEVFKKYLKKHPYGRVKIGDNVYIGTQSVIMPGVTIGDNVIIGANSVVTHDIPPNCIVAGTPARKIRELNFDD